MQDRYKILIITITVISIVAIVVLLIGLSFLKVPFNSYAIPYNKITTAIQPTTPLTYGRYFIGLQYELMNFPRGYLRYQFNLNCNTLDKTPINIEALFIGKLIQSQIVNLYAAFGLNYDSIFKLSIEQIIRQSVQNFTIIQIISNRTAFQNYVQSNVKVTIENQYKFLYCQMLLLGEVGTKLQNLAVFNQEISLQASYLKIMQQTVKIQKQLNFYNANGSNIINILQNHHAKLFGSIVDIFNSTNNSVSYFSTLTNQQKLYLMTFIISNPITKTFNTISIDL